MARKCKFDCEWEQALSLLPTDEADRARAIIENYQQTGVMPETLEPQMEMILLLVRPMIDRRRRASESARRRRQMAKNTQSAAIKPQADAEPEPEIILEPATLPPHSEKPVVANGRNSLSVIAEKGRRRNRKRRKFRH